MSTERSAKPDLGELFSEERSAEVVCASLAGSRILASGRSWGR